MIRHRAGTAWEHALFHATGGVAFGGFNNTHTDASGFFTGNPGSTANVSNTSTGWTLGGGIEYAVTGNWSIRAEYRFADSTPNTFGLGSFVNHHETENAVRAGFSYIFDSFGGTPVAAGY